MAWNEPGGDNRDPWSGSGRNQGPPDLDELFKKAQARVRRLFGRPGAANGNGGGGGGFGSVGVALVVAVLLGVWLLSGLYIVDEGKRGVVLRFGDYARTTMPGMHWHWPYPIEEARTVDVSARRIIRIGYGGNGGRGIPTEGLMLTRDEAIVNVQLAVQWQVSDPAAYVFTLLEPEQTLKQLTESALREAVGKRTLDFVLTEGRTEVVEATRDLVQEGLERYEAGISLVEVAIQDVQPPEEVQEAFADVIRAREDQQRLINEARAYSNQVLPRASGEAARIAEEAEGYKVRVIEQAEGETDRFLALLDEYRQAPEVTRERLYLETMEQVLGRSSKALIGVENGQPLMYLPLDKMMERSRRTGGADGAEAGNTGRAATGSNGTTAGSTNTRDDRLRNREAR